MAKSMIYEPQEDSHLLLRHVHRFVTHHPLAHSLKMLDMGTGSGIIAKTLATYAPVVASDINNEALEQLRDIPNIHPVYSSLFSEIKIRFDVICFNPPYLPYDVREPEEIRAITTGGKHGYELLAAFIADAAAFLQRNGRIFIVFSSLTRKSRVDSLLTLHLFEFKELERMSISFETLYCYEIWKKPVLDELEERGILEVTPFSRGKHSMIYRSGNVVVKVPPKQFLTRVLYNEEYWLKLLNQHGIGPKFLFSTPHSVVMEFVDGIFFEQYINHVPLQDVLAIIHNLLQQCFTLDQLGVAKEEMSHPRKHIIMRADDCIPVLIDFERTHRTNQAHNVTQFLQYLSYLVDELNRKGFKTTPLALRELAKHYSSTKDLKSVLEYFQ